MNAGTDAVLQARRLMNGFRTYQLVVVACRLGVPDLLASGPKTAAEIASATGTHEPSMRRVLRGLAACRFVTEEPDGRFAPTAVSDLYRVDVPGMRRMAVMLAEEGYSVWSEALYTVKTGLPAFEHVYGKSRWEQLAENPASAADFNAAMVETTSRLARGFVAGYDLGGARTVVDVGGGNGALLEAVLRALPDARGVLFDLPAGLAGARERFTAAGLEGRVDIVEGSFFGDIPAGADLYLLKSIVHDWDEARGRAILTQCRLAMGAGSRLVLIERTMPERIDDPDAYFAQVMSDLHMMVVLGGGERTPNEYGELLASAGLRMTRHVPFDPEFGAVEAVSA